MSDLPQDFISTSSKLFMDLQIKQTEMQADIKYIRENIVDIKSSIKDSLCSYDEKIEEFKKEVNEGKANKWVELLSLATVSSVIAGIVYLFFHVVVK